MEFTPTFSVSEAVEVINQHLTLLGEIVIEGEISRIDVKNSRLIFITITDPGSALDVFALTHQIRNLRQLEEGMLVHVHGTAGLYKGSGRFRIFAHDIAPHGAGALQVALEKLKLQLEQEGLFDESHKRTLPEWPQNIGVITAAESSAYFDVTKILKARMGNLTIKHLPVTVQGGAAVPSLLRAFRYINTHPSEFDVVILSRGGGSLEDLAAFNSEEITRAVFSSKVPIVSAVGHEDDWSLTDYTADLRASTPSNAAELVVKDRQDVRVNLDLQFDRLKSLLHQQVADNRYQISHSLQTIKHQIGRVSRRVELTIHEYPRLLKRVSERINRSDQDITQTFHNLHLKITNQTKLTRLELEHLSHLLQSLDYKNVLKRGFSITKLDSRILKTTKSIKPGQSLTTILADGEFISIVNSGA
jgi:exodeoxyribonuclease VII large subunit